MVLSISVVHPPDCTLTGSWGRLASQESITLHVASQEKYQKLKFEKYSFY